MDTAQIVLAVVTVLILPALGLVHRGIVRRLDDGRAVMTQQSEAIQEIAIGQAELRGEVRLQGAELGGRIDGLAQKVEIQNGRVVRVEGDVDVLRVQQIDGINHLLRAMTRTQEDTRSLSDRVRRRGLEDDAEDGR